MPRRRPSSLPRAKWRLRPRPSGYAVNRPPPRPLIDVWSGVVSWIFRCNVSGLRADFRACKSVVDKSETQAFLLNMGKNRYKDVPCLDETRVVLEDGGNDYIHANYFATPGGDNRFICCQAPLKETVVDHWRMIVQEKVYSIVMLCDYMVDGKEKCSEYIPTTDKPEMTFGPFTIKLIKTAKFKWKRQFKAIVNTSTLEVFKDGKSVQEVIHYHWINLPERGLPPVELAAYELLMAAGSGPIMVHDSSGVGWAGVFVFFAYAVDVEDLEKRNDLPRSLPALWSLAAVRKERTELIETEAQYVYVHMLLLQHLKRGKHLSSSAVEILEGDFAYEYDLFARELLRGAPDWR
ncbi:unnamed protein product, partial [Mesorhabditis spiculigera]